MAGEESNGWTAQEKRQLTADIAVLKNQMNNLEAALPNFVTKEEFSTIKVVVYGIVGMALIGVFGALLALVFRPHGEDIRLDLYSPSSSYGSGRSLPHNSRDSQDREDSESRPSSSSQAARRRDPEGTRTH